MSLAHEDVQIPVYPFLYKALKTLPGRINRRDSEGYALLSCCVALWAQKFLLIRYPSLVELRLRRGLPRAFSFDAS